MFDIEVFLKKCDDGRNKELWYSEIKSRPVTRGISQYIFDKVKDEETLKQFQDDCHLIEELRGWLWEEHGNRYLPMKEASDRHYSEIVAHVKNVLKEFCDKYDELFINED